MENKLIIFVLLYALAASETTNIISNNVSQGKKSIYKSKQARSLDRCLSVTCQPGFFCLYGLCKKVDYECINVICENGQRCKQGKCIKQLYHPKNQICAALDFAQEKQRCTDQLRARCLYGKSSTKVCGYFPNRTQQEFDDQCSACSIDNPVRFYYKTSCQWAPKICDQSQECLNGACTKLLNEHVYDNYRTCNENKDCKQLQVCGGHKCLKRQELFNYMTSKLISSNKGLTI